MKQYNSDNFSRYKKDVRASQPEGKFWDEYTRDELVIKFMPLVEKISRNFKQGDAASGVLSSSDAMQFGFIGLIKAVDKIIWKQIFSSKDPERTLKSYIAKRVRGAIRRAIDGNRTGMRIPEHKLNEIRKNFDDEKNAQLYYNSIFESIDINSEEENSFINQIEDVSEDSMKVENLSKEILNVMKKCLSDKEYHVIRLSYGLGCDKQSAKEIAQYLNIEGVSSYVRVSQLKKQAIDKLKSNMNYSQVADYL
jgi:RNA polymerase sigma factor (sigma-70 family)